jgi:hypothetical protein
MSGPWATWQWANAKIEKKNPYIAKKRPRQNPYLIAQEIKN